MMNIPTATRDRAERRNRALALRRRITTIVAAAGVGAVGVIGYVVAQSPAKTTLSTVSTVPVGEDTLSGDDGGQRASATSLSPGTATAGSAASATAVTGAPRSSRSPDPRYAGGPTPDLTVNRGAAPTHGRVCANVITPGPRTRLLPGFELVVLIDQEAVRFRDEGRTMPMKRSRNALRCSASQGRRTMKTCIERGGVRGQSPECCEPLSKSWA
jgi:hypothetical protein